MIEATELEHVTIVKTILLQNFLTLLYLYGLVKNWTIIDESMKLAIFSTRIYMLRKIV